MAYDIDFIKKAQLKLHIRKFLLHPEYWNDVNNQIPYRLRWKGYKFEKKSNAKIPNHKGVYCFVVSPQIPNFFGTKYLFYVGQTTRTLRERFYEYLNDQKGKGKPRAKVYEMLKLYQDSLYFFCSNINDNGQIDEVERKLLDTFVPHINTSIPKAKINPELRNIYE